MQPQADLSSTIIEKRVAIGLRGDDEPMDKTNPNVSRRSTDDQIVPTHELVALCSELEAALAAWRTAPRAGRDSAANRLRSAGRALMRAIERHCPPD